jgi:hypothetical protein
LKGFEMISEIDLQDMQPEQQAKKLYDVERQQVVSLVEEPTIPFFFDHIDGMYSYCLDLAGNLMHPSAWSDVFVWKKG